MFLRVVSCGVQALYSLVEMPSQMFSDEKVRKEEYLDGYDDPVLVGCEDYEPIGTLLNLRTEM